MCEEGGKVCECVRKVRRCVWGGGEGELTYNSSDTSKLVSALL